MLSQNFIIFLLYSRNLCMSVTTSRTNFVFFPTCPATFSRAPSSPSYHKYPSNSSFENTSNTVSIACPRHSYSLTSGIFIIRLVSMAPTRLFSTAETAHFSGLKWMEYSSSRRSQASL